MKGAGPAILRFNEICRPFHSQDRSGWFVHQVSKADDVIEATQIQETSKKKEKRDNLKFPENPDDLLPELPRDKRGRIQTADNLRIRPEQHPMQEGETFSSRHHG